MWVILLEAAGALMLLVLIVWWTMFSGRDKGELRPEAPESPPPGRLPKPDDTDSLK